MMVNFSLHEREITAVRFLPRWFGGYRIEIKRRQVRIRITGPSTVLEEEAGNGPWRKMRATDYPEVARFL